MFVTGRGVIGYGVANGAAGGMSIRGIGGSPNTQVLVLIDGHPQYMGMMGHPLPDVYESAMAEKIEVVRGPASVLYGSNAMAGVVNIVTKKQQQDGVHTYGRAMYGSYNTFSAEAHNAFRRKGFSSFVSLNYNRTDGHRENSEFDQYGGYAKLGYEFSSHWNVFADVNVTHYNAANPGLVSAPMIDNDAETTISIKRLPDDRPTCLKLALRVPRNRSGKDQLTPFIVTLDMAGKPPKWISDLSTLPPQTKNYFWKEMSDDDKIKYITEWSKSMRRIDMQSNLKSARVPLRNS